MKINTDLDDEFLDGVYPTDTGEIDTDNDEGFEDEDVEYSTWSDDINEEENTIADTFDIAETSDDEITVQDDSEEFEEEETEEPPDTETEKPVIKVEDSFVDSTGDIVVAEASDNGEKFELRYVDIKSIVVPKTRIRRFGSSDSLAKSVAKTGLLRPLEVVETKDGKYCLVNGYRRLWACYKNGIKVVPCVLNTKISSVDVDILEALYNHYTPYNNKELNDYISYLEKEKQIYDANIIEYLLQMPSGDYTKLKDVLADNDPDIVDKLMEDNLSISAAFKKLEARRKKESKEQQELKKVDRVFDSKEESVGKSLEDVGVMGDGESVLTEDEIKKLAIDPEEIGKIGEAPANGEEAPDEPSLDDMVKEGSEQKGFEPHKQDYKHREILSPELRKAVLARDNNTCQICKAISGQEYTEVLDVHHIIEVYLGGSDSIDNLTTACTVCHKLIHLYARGDLHIRPESEMTDEDKAKFKRIVKLGNIIREGMAKKGMKKNDLKKVDNAETIGRTKPGTARQVAG